MNEHNRQMLLAHITNMCEQEDVRVVSMRGAINITQPGDQWETFKPGDTTFIILAVGNLDPLEYEVTRLIEQRLLRP